MGFLFGKKKTSGRSSSDNTAVEQPKAKTPTGETYLSIAIHISKMEEYMDAGYSTEYIEDRLSSFTKAVEHGILAKECLSSFVQDSAVTQKRDSILTLICEALLQVEWTYELMGQQDLRDQFYLANKTTIFPYIQNPNAIAHFAMAHGFMLTMDDDKFPTSPKADWVEAFKHYQHAYEKAGDLETDRFGVYPYSCYNLGIFFKHGWGVSKNNTMALHFLRLALNAGFDCQDTIDSILAKM